MITLALHRADRLAARALRNTSGLGAHVPTLVIGGLVYFVVMSFFVSAVCGYMAGLIGSSNSPLSGIGILVVIGAAVLLVFGVKPRWRRQREGPGRVRAVRHRGGVRRRRIANNNLQDLKTGQLVDATPSKQQGALIVGVIAGAAVIPPILDLLNQAYGFAGAPGAEPRPRARRAAGRTDLGARAGRDRRATSTGA